MRALAIDVGEVVFARAGADLATSWIVFRSGKEVCLSPDESLAVIGALRESKTGRPERTPQEQPNLSTGEESSPGWIFQETAG